MRALLRGHVGKIALGTTVSLVIVVLVLRSLDVRELGSELAGANLWPVLPAIAFYFAGILARTVRWRLLLPRGAAPASDLYKALIIGFTINDLLPVRVGEIGRAYLLKRWRGVPYGTTVASLVVERVLDGLALTALLGVGLLFVPAPGYVRGLGVVAAAMFLGGTVVLMIAAWRYSTLARIAAWVNGFLPPVIGGVLARLAEGFTHGLAVLRGGRLLLQLVVLSLAAWVLELALFYVLLYALPVPRSIPLALVSGAVANFATLVPSSPGYVGTFDGALAKVVVDTAGVSPELAAAYALLTHAVLFLPVIIAGLTLLWRSGISFEGIARAAAPRMEEPQVHASDVAVLPQ